VVLQPNRGLGDCLLMFLDHTQTQTQTLGSLLPTSDQHVATRNSVKGKHICPCSFPCPIPRFLERSRCKYTAHTAQPAGST